MITLRRMTKTDLINFNGESFRDGCLPLIGSFQVDNQTITAIVDDRSLALIYEAGREIHLPLSDALNVLFQFKAEMTREFLDEILSNYYCRMM